MDRHHVLRPGCPLFLGLGLLCPPYCDRLVLHDQPVPGGNSHAVLRDEEAGNGADAPGTGALPIDVHIGQHVGQRVNFMLPADHQVHCTFVAEEQATYTQTIQSLPQPEEAAATATTAGSPTIRQTTISDAFAQFKDAAETATAQEEEEEAEQASAS